MMMAERRKVSQQYDRPPTLADVRQFIDRAQKAHGAPLDAGFVAIWDSWGKSNWMLKVEWEAQSPLLRALDDRIAVLEARDELGG